LAFVENHYYLEPVTSMPEKRLTDVPVGRHVRLASIEGGRQLTRRLLALGLSVDEEIEVLQHRGRGVVVAIGANRIALGGGIAEKLLVETLD
jgi:ferrous iron transport protein A